MRIKVKVDVRMPLKGEKKVKKPGGDWRVVKFKYERLGIFCFLCGVLGHSEHFCEKLFTMEDDDGPRGWGSKLRAETRRGGAGGSRWLREGSSEWVTAGNNDSGNHGSTVTGRVIANNSTIIINHDGAGMANGNSFNGKEAMTIDEESNAIPIIVSVMVQHTLQDNSNVDLAINGAVMVHANHVEDHAEKKRRRDALKAEKEIALTQDISEPNVDHF